ncbi:sensor histidine kinase [Streptomyces sp. NPDC001068]|uniref:sensor histidine kinase n=1 Tax=Streptomyces sp. NPDC001068 TaxID=3364544 RepID=UPI003685659F
MSKTPRITRQDIVLAVGTCAVQSVLAVASGSGGRGPDALGWGLLTGSAAVLAWRRHRPMAVMLAIVVLIAPYHALDYVHQAALPASLVALYSVAVAGPRPRTYATLVGSVTLMAGVMTVVAGRGGAWDVLRVGGWILAVVVLGDAVRINRRYVASVLERAERAELSREEEAARRVVDERMRIARDLHDLLAHSITVIGVQASVAGHVLREDPELLDRAQLAQTLEGISDTCRDARAELRATLEVLRAGQADERPGPVPSLAGLPDLARVAEAAGLTVDLGDAEPPAVPPAVGVAAYRIVQEALTNAVRHAPGCRVRVALAVNGGRLRLTVEDDGPRVLVRDTAARPPSPGYGLIGMRERARSVGGTLTTGPRPANDGFAISADLPLCATLEATR